MKAHIVKTAPLALLYGMQAYPDMAQAVCAACAEKEIETKVIQPQQLSQPVGALAGWGGRAAPPYTGAAPDVQLLLMSHFSTAQLNALLDALREVSVSVPLKAVVTKHNRTWSVLTLIEELQREKAAVEQNGAAVAHQA